MKMYNNGPRKGMMYGGGATPRKPMMYGGMTTKKKKMNMGGLASQNRKKTTAQSAEMSPMGGMTEQKRFSMGMMYGGTANKKKMLYGGQAKLDMNKNNKIDKEDFKILKKKK